jgi:hypothetical protein
MGDEWKDLGPGGGHAEQVIDTIAGGGGEKGGLLGDTRTVEEIDTGETREVYRGYGQTTGEAIEKGQFKDNK